jgi:hypothetical protein
MAYEIVWDSACPIVGVSRNTFGEVMMVIDSILCSGFYLI